jgi:hypothetical protein
MGLIFVLPEPVVHGAHRPPTPPRKILPGHACLDHFQALSHSRIERPPVQQSLNYRSLLRADDGRFLLPAANIPYLVRTYPHLLGRDVSRQEVT